MKSLVLVLAMAGASSPLSAQRAVRSELSAVAATDSGSSDDGRRAGVRAANEIPVEMRAFAAFMGGLPLGFAAPLVLFGGDPTGALGVGGGLAVITAAMIGPTSPSKPLGLLASERGQTYAQGFADGYSQRLRSRRKVAAIGGGVAGAVTGFGVLYFILTHLSD